MTYHQLPVTMVSCDRPGHSGPPWYKVEFGPGVTAAEALRVSGWHQSGVDLKHVCPDCVKRLAIRN